MSDYDGSNVLMGIKQEVLAGDAVPLVDADFFDGYLDAQGINYSSDHSQSGKLSNGKKTNPAISYNRTSAGTVPVKFEITRTDTPTVKPFYFRALELAGMKASVIDSGTNDNYQISYDGSPQCGTGTIETKEVGCGDNTNNTQLRGAVIADGTISFEGNGSPLMFEGTASGAFSYSGNDSATTAFTKQTDSAILSTGMLFAIGGTVYNVTNLSVSLNLGAVMLSDWGQADKSNISHFKLREGGQTTLTFGAIPVSPDGIKDYDKILASLKSGTLEGENADAKIIIDEVQFTDLQKGQDPIMGVERTAICTNVTIQLK